MRCWILWQIVLLMFSLSTFNALGLVNALVVNLELGRGTHPSQATDDPADNDLASSKLTVYKRTIINPLDLDWVSHTIPSAAIYPVEIGAQILGKFYAMVAVRASGVWTSLVPTNFYSISFGTINLYFWSTDSTVRIAWDFIHGIAVQMFEQSQRGFVGLFDTAFVHMTTGVVVHVKLIIKGKGGHR